MKRGLAVSLAIVASLVVTSTASARVRLASITSPASPGSRATLVATVSPNATCSIVVHYKSGPSRAKGLGAKRTVRGRVSWTWMVGTNTTAGRWGITVSCGAAGTLRSSFVVR
jgi:hypothetical protein